MSGMDLFIVVLVVAAFSVFGLTLAVVSTVENRRAKGAR
jgi:hypothetical protein